MNTHEGSPPNSRITTPREGVAHVDWDEDAPIDAPLRLHEVAVPAAWVDYNHHMSESAYLLAVGDNADAFFRYFGIDEAYRAAGGSLYTAETHLHHLDEASEGDVLQFTLQVLGVDSKRLHIVHELTKAQSGALVATAEQMLLHVAMKEGKVAPMPDYLLQRLSAIHRAHAALPVPEYVGHVMGLSQR